MGKIKSYLDIILMEKHKTLYLRVIFFREIHEQQVIDVR